MIKTLCFITQLINLIFQHSIACNNFIFPSLPFLTPLTPRWSRTLRPLQMLSICIFLAWNFAYSRWNLQPPVPFPMQSFVFYFITCFTIMRQCTSVKISPLCLLFGGTCVGSLLDTIFSWRYASIMLTSDGHFNKFGLQQVHRIYTWVFCITMSNSYFYKTMWPISTTVQTIFLSLLCLLVNTLWRFH